MAPTSKQFCRISLCARRILPGSGDNENGSLGGGGGFGARGVNGAENQVTMRGNYFCLVFDARGRKGQNKLIIGRDAEVLCGAYYVYSIKFKIISEHTLN